MKLPLTGIIPPLVTPLRGRDELDVPGLERLVDRVVGGGASGLFVLGTTGEGPSLSYRLRRDVISRVCALTRGRVPVLVAVTDTSFVETVALARHAADAGADAVVAAPPYYLPEGQPELQEYLDHLIPELPLPLLLYDMPSITKVSFEEETLRRAMGRPRVIGLKDSSGDLQRFRARAALAAERPDWTLLMGPEELLAEAVAAGGHGGVCGGANLFPQLFSQLFQAARAKEHARVTELHGAVLRLGGSLYRIGHHSSAIIKGLKCALASLNICDDFMAEPFHRFRAGERSRVEKFLAEFIPELQRLGLQ